jgi:hypothetical protein
MTNVATQLVAARACNRLRGCPDRPPDRQCSAGTANLHGPAQVMFAAARSASAQTGDLSAVHVGYGRCSFRKACGGGIALVPVQREGRTALTVLSAADGVRSGGIGSDVCI